MTKLWKYTALLTLILLGGMQALPFIPTHTDCKAACCVSENSCCAMESNSGCEMAMTSCSVSLFMPLISAPLVKVDNIVELNMENAPPQFQQLLIFQHQADLSEVEAYSEAPPPRLTPLLI